MCFDTACFSWAGMSASYVRCGVLGKCTVYFANVKFPKLLCPGYYTQWPFGLPAGRALQKRHNSAYFLKPQVLVWNAPVVCIVTHRRNVPVFPGVMHKPDSSLGNAVFGFAQA